MDLPNSAHQWQDGNSHAKTTNVPNINAVDTSASQTARTPLAFADTVNDYIKKKLME